MQTTSCCCLEIAKLCRDSIIFWGNSPTRNMLPNSKLVPTGKHTVGLTAHFYKSTAKKITCLLHPLFWENFAVAPTSDMKIPPTFRTCGAFTLTNSVG